MPDSHRCIWVWQYCPTQICLTGSVRRIDTLWLVGFHTFAYIRLIKVWAYAIRVMLAHVRIKQISFIKNPEASKDSPEMQALFALFAAQLSETSTPRTAPSTSNPFASFQDDDDDEDDEQQEDTQDDDVICVHKSVQHGDYCMFGVMQKSNGTRVAAHRYAYGSDGFIVCYWDGIPPETLGTEIPNAQLETEDSNFILKPYVEAEPQQETKKKKKKEEA